METLKIFEYLKHFTTVKSKKLMKMWLRKNRYLNKTVEIKNDLPITHYEHTPQLSTMAYQHFVQYFLFMVTQPHSTLFFYTFTECSNIKSVIQ